MTILLLLYRSLIIFPSHIDIRYDYIEHYKVQNSNKDCAEVHEGDRKAIIQDRQRWRKLIKNQKM